MIKYILVEKQFTADNLAMISEVSFTDTKQNLISYVTKKVGNQAFEQYNGYEKLTLEYTPNTKIEFLLYTVKEET